MKGNDPYSYPPRGLSREASARYIGVSTTKFDEMVSDRRMPRPIRIDGRVIWDRIKIDMAFSELGEVRENMIDALLRRTGDGQSGSPRSATPPLDPWEHKVMRQFEDVRAGGIVRAQTIFGLGPTTAEKLRKRGFIEPRFNEKIPDQIDRWMLTEAGAAVVRQELGRR